MLHKETINKETFELIKNLQQKEYLQGFILVGGTALSLINGYRISIDIDLFSKEPFNASLLYNKLETDFQFELDYLEENTLKGSIHSIKIDILTRNYYYIEAPKAVENIVIASEKDLCAMKINAITNDGTRVKDFIDIYFLLEKYTVSQILSFFEQKYVHQNSFNALKSLAYFDEVNLEDWPPNYKRSKP